MRLVVFGAAGDVGCRIVKEAIARGHEVTGVTRNRARADLLPAGAKAAVADVTDSGAVARAMEGHDLAISAIRPPDGREQELAGLTRSILTAAAQTGMRLLVVGGASSLKMPGEEGLTLLESGGIPDAVMPIARASFAQWKVCAAEPVANWTYLCPSAVLLPGKRSGVFRRGTDTLLVDEDGNSAISMEDLAIALIDEAETPKHERARFTVGY